MAERKVPELEKLVQKTAAHTNSKANSTSYVAAGMRLMAKTSFANLIRKQASGEEVQFGLFYEEFKKESFLSQMALLPASSIVTENRTKPGFRQLLEEMPVYNGIKDGTLKTLKDIESDSRVVFVSHKWESPDEYTNPVNIKAVFEALDHYCTTQQQNLNMSKTDYRKSTYFWMDYWGVVQNYKNPSEFSNKGTFLGCLHLYMAVSTDLLVLFNTNQDMENKSSVSRANNKFSWYNSLWCRLELAIHYMVNDPGKTTLMAKASEDCKSWTVGSREMTILSPLDKGIYCHFQRDRSNLNMMFQALVHGQDVEAGKAGKEANAARDDVLLLSYGGSVYVPPEMLFKKTDRKSFAQYKPPVIQNVTMYSLNSE